jgi:hypothetical protein
MVRWLRITTQQYCLSSPYQGDIQIFACFTNYMKKESFILNQLFFTKQSKWMSLWRIVIEENYLSMKSK